jgi:hypothetical protein
LSPEDRREIKKQVFVLLWWEWGQSWERETEREREREREREWISVCLVWIVNSSLWLKYSKVFFWDWWMILNDITETTLRSPLSEMFCSVMSWWWLRL